MKNKDYKKLVTIAVATALIIGSLGITSAPTLAKDTKTITQTEKTEHKNTTEKTVSSDVKPVSYTHLTLPTTPVACRSRWSPYH